METPIIEEKKRFRRRNFLIQPSLQIKYALIMLFLFLAAGFVVWFETYRNFAGLSSKHMMYFSTVMATLKSINIIILIKMGILLVTVLVFAIVALHLLAGPVFRIESSLKILARGDFSGEIHLRKGDQLKKVASIFNATINSLQDIVRQDRKIIAEAVDELSELEKKCHGKDQVLVGKIKDKIQQLSQSFKID